jgi:hypothetical protein
MAISPTDTDVLAFSGRSMLRPYGVEEVLRLFA